MKKQITVGLIFLLSYFALAQMSSAATNESEIRQALDDWAKAFRSRDINGIMAMYAPDVVAFDFIAPLQYVGKDSYRKDYEQFLAQFKGPVEVEFREMKVISSDDVGFVHTLERISGTMTNGEKIEFWGRCTSGFRKISGKWMDIHDHCSVPADFETGKAVLDLKP